VGASCCCTSTWPIRRRRRSLLFRADTRWASSFLRFFKITEADRTRFLLHLRVAAYFHDIGKANQGFQQAMRAATFQRQPVRHEHLSALVLAHTAVQRWLGTNGDLDQDIVAAAVLSHHLKAAPSGDFAVMQSASNGQFALYFAHEQVTNALAAIADIAGLSGELPRLPSSYQPADQHWDAAYENLLTVRAPRFAKAIAKDLSRRALCLAVKAGVIAADSVASAMFREALDLPAWVDEVAHAPPLAADSIERDILRPRIHELDARRGSKRFEYHRFQDGAAGIGDRGLLLAACGTGKTMAAWRWADAVAKRRPIGRVVFLYPTRGTATEGFRDYVGHAPEGTARLVHGTARYELQGMLANPEDRPPSLQGKDLTPTENEDRLFALGLWPKRYFSATVDQFLGFMQHDYRGLCMLPALADAAVIFDEVHSYDTRTCGSPWSTSFRPSTSRRYA
jgi:CRISPR-associated endonuclease/helicase Cas3